MSEISDNLANEAVEYQISLLRVEAGMRAKAVAQLEQLEGDLTKILAENKNLAPGRKKQIENVLQATNEVVGDAYKQINESTLQDLDGVATATTKKTVNDLSGQIGVSVGAMKLTPQQITEITRGPIIEGNPIGTWWNAQAEGTQRKITGAVRQGMFLGDDMDTIARSIRGSKAANYEDGILAVSRREAQSIARTAVQSVANQAKIATLANSSDVVKGIEWISTLDNRTTPTCRALDGLQWRLPDYEPVGHDKKFPGTIAHWGCRSTQIAVTRSWSELAGKPVPGPDPATFEESFRANLEALGKTPAQIASAVANQRASMDGTTSAGLDFDAWARTKGDDYIRKLLGPGRFDLWKANNLTMRDLTDQRGRELTIAQLQDSIEAGGLPAETEGVEFIPFALPPKPPEQPIGPPAPDQKAAAATIAETIANPKGKTQLAKALTQLQKTEPNLLPSDMLAKAQGIAQEKQAAASKASALSVAKANLVKGKPPTLAQQAYIDSLTPEELFNFEEAVKDAINAGETGQLESLITKINAIDLDGPEKPTLDNAPEWQKLTGENLEAAKNTLADKQKLWEGVTTAKILNYIEDSLQMGAEIKLSAKQQNTLQQLSAPNADKVSKAFTKAVVAKDVDDVVTDYESGALDATVAIDKIKKWLPVEQDVAQAGIDKIEIIEALEKPKKELEAMAKQPGIIGQTADSFLKSKLNGYSTDTWSTVLDDAKVTIDLKVKTEIINVAIDGKNVTKVKQAAFKSLTGIDPVKDPSLATDFLNNFDYTTGESASFLEKVEVLAAEKQAALNLASNLSKAKKKLAQGKEPSPSEKAAIASLDPTALANFNQQVADAKLADNWLLNLYNTPAAAPAPTQAAATTTQINATTKTATQPDVNVANLDLYVPDPAGLKIIKTLSGSTRPTLREDTTTGKLWVIKSPDQGGGGPEHLKTEATADQLYRIMGASVPGSKYLESQGQFYKVAEYLDGAETLGAWEANATPQERADVYAQLQEHFVMDALLGNWDVAGQSNDNIMVLQGKAIRIDNGGSLDFRAQGTKKTADQFAPEVTELKSLRDPSTAAGKTAQIFAGVTQSQIDDQIVAILAKRDDLIETVRAARGDAVAKALGKRIDYLAKLLPAEKKKAKPRKASPEADLLQTRGLTQSQLEKGAATRFGIEILAGGNSFEDQAMTVWRERAPDNSETVKLQGTLTLGASESFLNRLKAAKVDVSEGKSVAVKPSTSVATLSIYDTFWFAMESAGKTIGMHAADGQYNASTLATYETTKKELLALQKTLPNIPYPGSPEEEKKLIVEHYLKMADILDEAMFTKIAPAKYPQFELGANKQPAGAAAATGPVAPQISQDITIERMADDVFHFTRKQIGPDGILVDQNIPNFDVSAGRTFVIKSGNVEVKIVPYLANATTNSNQRSLQGQVRVTVKGNDATAATMEAFRVLEEAGIDVAPPTQAQREILYIHKTLYLRNQHNNPQIRAIMNSADSDETKVDRLKDWAEKEYGVKIPRTKNKWTKYYNPDGELPKTDAGRRIYRRIDYNEKEAKAAEAKTRFYHTGDIEAATLGWLTNGGWATSTTDRLRSGVPMNSGASWPDDYNKGGGGYFYTNRIDAKQSQGEGFYFKGDLVTRVDLASHTYDSYGEWDANSGGNRRRTLDEINSQTRTGYTYNTGLFKGGMSVADLDQIRINNPDALIAKIKAAGFQKWVDGRELTEVIKNYYGT